MELGRVEHREAGLKMGEVGWLRADEHVPDEERVPSTRRDEPDRQLIRMLGPGEQILDEQLPGIEEASHVAVQALERLRVHPRVLVPPDARLGVRLHDDELVFG